ncbi:MAG: methyltransferase domain-containing protein [Gemmatimonadetes bacterium]|nr:methyltransferase domain-containing protein [Gemmatimonadota bacterium]MYD25903.1 methyltransferase domain-containing protein [Gemmatimonadota bacterium]MYI98208.1 methyltransferase domain-containing protein [Gemmatimonadota bacterium]
MLKQDSRKDTDSTKGADTRKAADQARIRARMPSGTEEILNERTLSSSHRRLDELLRPGMRVLDVGCGTGAITRGIDEKIDSGVTVGLDIDIDLIRQAVDASPCGPGFVAADILHMPFYRTFDLVSAARVIQWHSAPRRAIECCISAITPGGRFLALDYNHEKIVWDPCPPASMQAFYEAFLAWRSDAGMDNAIADNIAPALERLGLVDIRETAQHEYADSHDGDGKSRLGIWSAVAATRGFQLVQDGYLTESQRAAAEADSLEWIDSNAVSQTLYLLAVEGRVQR